MKSKSGNIQDRSGHINFIIFTLSKFKSNYIKDKRKDNHTRQKSFKPHPPPPPPILFAILLCDTNF